MKGSQGTGGQGRYCAAVAAVGWPWGVLPDKLAASALRHNRWRACKAQRTLPAPSRPIGAHPTNPIESTAPQGDAELNATSSAAALALGLTAAELEELDNLLDDLRTRGEEIPQWEFCDGFMTAVICSRRPIAPPNTCPCCWAMVPSWKWPKASRCRCCPPLPMLPSKRAFWNCGMRRWNEIVPARHRREDAGRRAHLPARSDGHARRRGQPA